MYQKNRIDLKNLIFSFFISIISFIGVLFLFGTFVDDLSSNKEKEKPPIVKKSNSLKVKEKKIVKKEKQQVKEKKIIYYRVKSGDSLYLIGQKFGINYKKIKSYNKLKTNSLNIGQKLKIPSDRLVKTNKNKIDVKKLFK